jgi:hypothetical protein
VDLDNPQHVEKLRRVFAAASAQRMTIAVHMHSSVTRHRAYGSKEAQIFLGQVLPSAAATYVEFAHFAGSGGYDDPATDEALCVFIRAMIAERTRGIGIAHVVFGLHGNFGAGSPPARAWADFRKVPLSQDEFWAIERNVTPCMRDFAVLSLISTGRQS